MSNAYPKILVVSINAWANYISSGNTFTNFFRGWDPDKIAHIFFREESPRNDICKNYYQLSEKQILSLFKSGRLPGKHILLNSPDEKSGLENDKLTDSFYETARKHRYAALLFIRDIIWMLAPWKNVKLRVFLSEFKPDVIFMPCHSAVYMHRIFRYLVKAAGAKGVLFFEDDILKLKQRVRSPIVRLYQHQLRRNIKKNIKVCAALYAITEELKQEYAENLNASFKLLRKGGTFEGEPVEKKAHKPPIKMIFAGNIFYKRYEVLAEVAKCLKTINANGEKMVLNVYTNNEFPNNMQALLKDSSVNVFKAIGLDALNDAYTKSDIALHVESFDKKMRQLTQLSFSTKIIDCMQSGAAILAIGPSENAGIAYLKRMEAAIVVNDTADLLEVLKELESNHDMISAYSQKAYQVGIRYHRIEDVRDNLRNDLSLIAKMNSDAGDI